MIVPIRVYHGAGGIPWHWSWQVHRKVLPIIGLDLK